jgi:hypothetical protein
MLACLKYDHIIQQYNNETSSVGQTYTFLDSLCTDEQVGILFNPIEDHIILGGHFEIVLILIPNMTLLGQNC